MLNSLSFEIVAVAMLIIYASIGFGFVYLSNELYRKEGYGQKIDAFQIPRSETEASFIKAVFRNRYDPVRHRSVWLMQMLSRVMVALLFLTIIGFLATVIMSEFGNR